MQKSIHSREYAIFLGLLRAKRRAAGVTQVQLAERLQTTQSRISHIETGERRLDVVELRVLCQAMGISIRQFIDELETALGADAAPGREVGGEPSRGLEARGHPQRSQM